MGDADGLGAVLDDIGARNSDVLLSDAVLFVEGPSDRDALRVWSERSITSLDENNVTVLPMGGGEFAERGARMRGEVLEGISEKAPVPHLFVLDLDERSRGEINRLRRRLTDRVHVLKSRELENYLLVPRALLAAIRSKHHDDAVITGKVDAASEEQVQQLISTTAEGLYELVVIKRIRAAIGGLRGGLLPRETAAALEPHVNSPDLPEVVSKEIESRVADHLSRLKVEKIVRDEKKMLDKEWADSNKHVRLAPGAEIIEEVFRQFGSGYKKPHDTVRIAQEMRAEEISREIGNLINRAVSLTAMEGVTS